MNITFAPIRTDKRDINRHTLRGEAEDTKSRGRSVVESEKGQGHNATGRIMVLKNSNDTIGN